MRTNVSFVHCIYSQMRPAALRLTHLVSVLFCLILFLLPEGGDSVVTRGCKPSPAVAGALSKQANALKRILMANVP